MFNKRLFMPAIASLIAATAIFSWPINTASAFEGAGCTGKCTDCHNISKEEAGKLLKTDKFKAEVKDIRLAPVKGLWEIELTQEDKHFIVYLDFAKKFLVEGKFTQLEKLGEQPKFKKIDVKMIPLESAIVFGSLKAEKKIIVFSDPDCPYCKKLHEEIKKILGKRQDVAFYIKLMPLTAIHPESYEKSKAIVCAKSQKFLEDVFDGKKLPKTNCETAELDNNIKLADEIGVHGTPAIILPDGRLIPGYVTSDVLLEQIDAPEK